MDGPEQMQAERTARFFESLATGCVVLCASSLLAVSIVHALRRAGVLP